MIIGATVLAVIAMIIIAISPGFAMLLALAGGWIYFFIQAPAAAILAIPIIYLASKL